MSRPRLISEILTVLFMLLVAIAAKQTRITYILFPELAALANEVLQRPGGKWAKVPWKLVATPTMTAAIGILISALLPYGVVPILIATGLSLVVIYLLKSAVAPAISAGVLAVALGVTSPLYPISVFCSLTILVLILLIWRQTKDGKGLLEHDLALLGRHLGNERRSAATAAMDSDLIAISDEDEDDQAIEILETRPRGKLWLLTLFVFTLIMGAAAQITGWRFLLFPPLIVMAYEMLGHPDTCPWAKSPFTFPIACTLSAAVGVGTLKLLGVGPTAVGLTLIGGILILRAFRLRMPPALAIGLIPFVIPSPSFRYALSVGIGSAALTLWFLLHASLVTRRTSLNT